MEKQLAQLLKDNFITADIKAKIRQLPRKKTYPDVSGTITPGNKEVESISKKIESLPVIIITLATALPKEEIKRLGRWFRRNVHPQVLLDIHQDDKIIGGCRIIWRGREGDFSLRKKFEGAGQGPAATDQT
jgi:hypothetical protein